MYIYNIYGYVIYIYTYIYISMYIYIYIYIFALSFSYQYYIEKLLRDYLFNCKVSSNRLNLIMEIMT